MPAHDALPAALRPLAEMPARRRVVVIGAGVVGAATACAAARIGGDRVRVDLYEAAVVGHDGGSSIDATRAFRHVYADGAHYSRWAAEALQLWRELEEQSGRRVYQRTGAVWVEHAPGGLSPNLEPYAGHHADRFVEASQRTLRALDIPHERLDGDAFRQRFPQFADHRITQAILDVDAGALFARDAVLALRDVAIQHGVQVHEGTRAVELRPDLSGCGVRFADGSSVEADVVVLAANGWSGELLPDLHDRVGPAGPDGERGLQLTEQPLYYFVPAPNVQDEFAVGRFPIFLFASSGLFGMPLFNGIVKTANDAPSRRLQRPEQRQLADADYRERLLAYIAQQIPALRDATLLQERVCFYDRSPDGDFVMDQWDASARLIVACGFSGHGFKFGPLLGDRLARYALTGQRPDELVPFSLARFGAGAATPAPAQSY